MAWFYLIRGVGLTVLSENPYHLEDALAGSDRFSLLEREAREAGLLLSCTPDPDEQSLVVFVGKEILADRHFYQGKTAISVGAVSDEDEAIIDALSDRLMALLDDMDTAFTLTRGIVLSQFD